MILSGEKTIESRFTKVKCLPFGRVARGDTLLLKQAAGPVRGEATVENVLYFENLSPREVTEVFVSHPGILAGKDFVEEKKGSRYATLIFLKDVKSVKPYSVEKKDRRPWVILGR